MERVTVGIGYAYRAPYVPRGKRTVETAYVAGRLPASLPLYKEAPPVAVSVERLVDPFRVYKHAEGNTRPETFHTLGGRLSRLLPGADAALLASIDEGWEGGRSPFQYVHHAKPPRVIADIAEMEPRRVDPDERAAAEAHALAMSERAAVTPAGLAVPSPEPVWAVRRAHTGAKAVQVVACLESDCRKDETMLAAVFRADRPERAMACARAMAAVADETGAGVPYAVEVAGSIEVRDPSGLAFDELAWNGPRMVALSANYRGGDGFAALPVPVLRAWTDFREAHARYRAGDGDALVEALCALGAAERAMPPRKAVGRDDEIGLRYQVAGLGAAAPFWAGDARELRAVAEADAGELAGLAP